MMRNGKLFLAGLVVVFLGAGCAQKVQVKAIKSAEVSDSSIKNIAVLPFENDLVSQSSAIDSALENHTLNGKKYFNVIDRKNLEKIIAEKKLNDSGLVELINNDGSMGLKEIETLVTGEVAHNSVSPSYYFEERTDYSQCVKNEVNSKGKTVCKEYKKYTVKCVSNLYVLTTNVKFIKVADSGVIFAKSFTENSKFSHCSDDSKILPVKEVVNTELASKIAKDLIKIVAPSYLYFSVTILDDEDIDFEKEQSKQLEVAIELIKKDRVEKANEMLKGLNNSLSSRSYTVLYDLAVTEEVLGNIYKANDLYREAENIALQRGEVIDEISYAIKRVAQNISEFEKAQKQINSLK